MGLPIHLALVPEGVTVSFSDLTTVSGALSKQVQRDFSPIWKTDATVDAFSGLDQVPPDYFSIIVTHVSDGGGYHQIKANGQPFAMVNFDDQWPLTASHECLEMLADPFGSRFVAGQLLDQAVALGMTPQRVKYLVEICDPSESAAFAYQVNGVTVSDFYTPNYFDPTASSGVRYSFHGSINKPREVLDGGYISWQDLSNGNMMQLRMFPDQFSNDVPHILNLSTLPGFEKLKAEEGVRAAVDRYTKNPPYNAGLVGSALQRANVGRHSSKMASAGWAAEIRAAMRATGQIISFVDVKAYLDAVAANATADIGNSPHGVFWAVDYTTFVNGTVPNVSCGGNPVPIISKVNPAQSPFFLILTDSNGWCGMPQMPAGGPFITNAGYTVTLADGRTITGSQIQSDLSKWLSNGFPENGA